MDGASMPAVMGGLPPPSGVTPNFVNPYNEKRYIIATLVICLTVSTLLVWTRLYTKIVIVKSHASEDCNGLFAGARFCSVVCSPKLIFSRYLCTLLGLVVECALIFETLNDGDATHQWDVPLDQVIRFAQFANAAQIVYAPVIFLTKLSILLQVLHIFTPVKKGKTYYAIHSIIWSNLLFYIADTFIEIFQCVPRTKIWSPSVPGHCVNINAVFTSTAIINIVSDFNILLLPIGNIWQLQMPLRRKMWISVVFAMGLFACIASILRLVSGLRIQNSKDETFVLYPVALWAVAEITGGIFCGCLPVLPQFFRHFAPKVRARLSSSNQNTPDHFSDTQKFGKPLAARRDLSDPYLLRGNYVELEEREHHPIRSVAAKTGTHSIAGDGNGHSDSNVEIDTPNAGIRKTVYLETTYR